jgi:hypothetical protein
MKFAVGKFYRTRDGHVAEVVKVFPDGRVCVIHYENGGSPSMAIHRPDGRLLGGKEDGADLITPQPKARWFNVYKTLMNTLVLDNTPFDSAEDALKAAEKKGLVTLVTTIEHVEEVA